MTTNPLLSPVREEEGEEEGEGVQMPWMHVAVAADASKTTPPPPTTLLWEVATARERAPRVPQRVPTAQWLQ